jgi:class 3 adenylate cyclase
VPFLFVLHGFLRRRAASLERLTTEREALLTYLPLQAVDRILPSGPAAIGPPSDLAIVFTDLRGFTSVSERLEPTRRLG